MAPPPSTAGAAAPSPQWFKGRVKSVPSGDSLLIMSLASSGPPLEKLLTLASLIAPRLARRGGNDEHFAWDSREFLRKLCIGKEISFRSEYNVSSIRREFGSVYLDGKNLAMVIVSAGWAKVKEPNQKSEASPFLNDLLQLEEKARQQGLGLWSQVPGAAEASVRYLPPSSFGDAGFDAKALVEANKGKPMEAVIEQVRDGSTVRGYLLPGFQFVQVFVAGVQSPSMGRKAPTTSATTTTSKGTNGVVSAESTEEQKSVVSAATTTTTTEVAPEPFAREAKFFTETRVLHRDVRIVLECTDSRNNLVGSVYYPDGETAKDLAQELIQNGFARCVQWTSTTLEGEVKERLRNAELQAKKSRLRIWTNYVPGPLNSRAIHNQNFTGKVVEVVSGDCIVVADDSTKFERRVNLSSTRCPKTDTEYNKTTDEKTSKPNLYYPEAKEYLRSRLIGQQVSVQMEYTRKVIMNEGSDDTRLMDFGSVFLLTPAKGDEAVSSSGDQPAGVNVAEMVIGRGLGSVVNHNDFEERSKYINALLAAEDRAKAQKKGRHSGKVPPVSHINDLTTSDTKAKKVKDHFLSLQRLGRVPAVVEYVLSGHRYKLLIPKQNCRIFFSLSGVRCPAKGQPYSDEAITFMRQKIMQRDVEIEIEAVDRIGTFLGTLWESRTNVGVSLLEAGLAYLQNHFDSDRIRDAHLLEQAQQSAKAKKLKFWENFVEGETIPNGSVQNKQKEVLKVVVTEIVDGGKFYIQTVDDQRVASIQQQLASLNIQDAPVPDTFDPKKTEIVLAQFSVDNSWNRAMILSPPKEDKYEVFYIDYGNQEEVSYSQLRPIIDKSLSVSVTPALAQLCTLAYIKVPFLDKEYGTEAAQFLSEQTMGSSVEIKAVVEEKETSGGKGKGQKIENLMVTLIPEGSEMSINAQMLQEGLAMTVRRWRYESRDRQEVMDSLEKFQEEARSARIGIWQYGDAGSDDEDSSVPQAAAAKKTGGRR